MTTRQSTRSIVVAAIAVALLTTFPISGAEPTPTEPALILGDEVWEDDDLVITDHIVVSSGASLTIRNTDILWQAGELCTFVQVNGNHCQPDLEVEPGGRLVIEDSSIRGPEDNVYDWPIIIVRGDVQVTGSTFTRIHSLITEFDEGTAEILGNTFESTISSVGVWRGAQGLIEGNTFKNSHAGASAQDASPTIVSNHFVNIDGIAIRVQQSIVGDKAFRTEPVIEGNLVEESVAGIFSDSGVGYSIQGNTFKDNQFGTSFRIPTADTMVQKEAPSLEENLFEGNENDISVYTVATILPGNAVQMEVHGNSFIDTKCTYIDASGSPTYPLTVEASGNWWGDASGPADVLDPDCEAFVGDATIVVAPWLTESP